MGTLQGIRKVNWIFRSSRQSGLTHHLCKHAKSDEMKEKQKQKFHRQSSKAWEGSFEYFRMFHWKIAERSVPRGDGKTNKRQNVSRDNPSSWKSTSIISSRKGNASVRWILISTEHSRIKSLSDVDRTFFKAVLKPLKSRFDESWDIVMVAEVYLQKPEYPETESFSSNIFSSTPRPLICDVTLEIFETCHPPPMF